MSSLAFAAGLRIESCEQPSQSANAGPRAPSIEELDSIELADHGNLTQQKACDSTSHTQTPSQCSSKAHLPEAIQTDKSKTPSDLERSEPSTPTNERATSIMPSFWFPKMNKWRVLAACLTYFGNGMSDSAPGALIPYVEEYYNIGYAIVSLIWIANACGFILSAFVNDPICARLGRARTLMLSEACMIAAYIAISCTPPFGVMVAAYLVMGFGNAMNLALNNVFCANLADSTVILGLSQGCYGIGGIVAPIVATTMVSSGILWSRFYIITVGVRLTCLCLSGWSFWNYEKEGTSHPTNSLHQTVSRQAASDQGEPSKLQLLGRALRNKVTLFGALFIFSYQGAEVSESGWFISYLIDYRNGDPAHVGYVTSGFWAGITVGRFVLTHVAPRIGEKRFVLGCTVGVIAFQLMSWLIPNIIGNAVSVAIVGLLLGPVYPSATTIFMKLLPARLQMIAISFISSAGSSGGAVVPFITGLVAQSVGTYVLHPICIAAYVLMIGCWVMLPKMKKRAAE